MRACVVLLVAGLAVSCGVSGRPIGGGPAMPGNSVAGQPGASALWLTGTISSGFDGSPLQGAMVNRLDGAGQAKSDRYGHYELKVNERPGATIHVSVSRGGYRTEKLEVRLVAGRTPLDVTLMPPDDATGDPASGS